MKEGDYCKVINNKCDPKDCYVEFCRWRDTVWAPYNLKRIFFREFNNPNKNNPRLNNKKEGE